MKPCITFDEKQTEKVEQLASSCTKQQIADYFGICFNTFHKICQNQPEVNEAYRRGRAMAVIDVAGSLIREAKNGNIQAAQFYLKTQAGWKETERKEISGIDGGPIETDNKWVIEVVGVGSAAEAGED